MYKELGYAVAHQAVKDYFVVNKDMKKKILKDLRSDWMYFITNGMSRTIAEKLEKNPREILRRLTKVDAKTDWGN